jgi:hypothetical protein
MRDALDERLEHSVYEGVMLPSSGSVEQIADPSGFEADDLFGPIEADTDAQLPGRLMHRRECLMHGLEGLAHLATGTKARNVVGEKSSDVISDVLRLHAIDLGTDAGQEHSPSIEQLSSLNLGEAGAAGVGIGPILTNSENDKLPATYRQIDQALMPHSYAEFCKP